MANLRPDIVYDNISIATEEKLEHEVERSDVAPYNRNDVSHMMYFVGKFNTLLSKRRITSTPGDESTGWWIEEG